MRILLVGRSHRREIRGANVAVQGLDRSLAHVGHEVTVLQAAFPGDEVRIPGVETVYTAETRKSRYPLRFALRSLKEFDVVHANDESAGVLALRSRLQHFPLVAELHTGRLHAGPLWTVGWRWRYIRAAIRHAPRIVVPSRWLAERLTETFGVEPRRLHVIEHGVGEHWFSSAARTPSEPPRVVLVNMRGVEVALRAFAAVGPRRGAKLELYGIHRDEKRYERLAEELRIREHICFHGFVPNATLPGRLAPASILLHPSEAESFGQVLAEAAALGLPVVASAVGAIPELVSHGETGLLCRPRDVAAFARALETLLVDRDERDRMARNARQAAEGRWRWHAVVARIQEEVYEPAIGLHSRRKSRRGT